MAETEPSAPERVSYKPLMALQSRMLLAASDLPNNIGVIDPKNTSVPEFSKEGLTSFDNHNYSLFNHASTNERRKQAGVRREELDQKVTEWADSCVALIKTNERHHESLQRIFGQDPKTFNTEMMVSFYNTFFRGENKESDLKSFVSAAIRRYSQDGKLNIGQLRLDFTTIKWFSHVFGTNSSDIVSQLIDAEVELLTNPDQFVQRGNENRNKITPDDDRLLTFLWDNRPTVQPTPEPSPPTPKPPTPEPTTPVEPPRPLEAGKSYRLPEIFNRVKDPVPIGHSYYIENPPADITLTPQQMESLKTTEPFFIAYEQGWAANPKAIPWDTFKDDARFNHAEDLTKKDSGTLALAAVSSSTPEKQATLYKTMAKAILSFHKQHPRFLEEWLNAQQNEITDFDPATKSNFNQLGYLASPMYIFVNYDVGRAHNLQEVLMQYDHNLKQFNSPLFNNTWTSRTQELDTLLTQPNPQLQPHHIRWLEFLSHSVKVGDLLKLIKTQQPVTPKPAEPPKQQNFSSLAEVPAIQESRNQMIARREQIKEFVEQPLLLACEEMWDKNVRTLSTSANQRDIQVGEAYIIIDFDSLSEENRKVAQHYAEPIDYNGMKAVKILIRVSESTTTDEISRKATEIASTFQKQPATWIPKYTLEYLKKACGIAPEETEYDDPSVWEGYHYDSKEKVFYLSEEHYKKANEKIVQNNRSASASYVI